jgi:hypothetical protein
MKIRVHIPEPENVEMWEGPDDYEISLKEYLNIGPGL